MSSDANDSLHCGYMYVRDSHLHPEGVSLGDSLSPRDSQGIHGVDTQWT